MALFDRLVHASLHFAFSAVLAMIALPHLANAHDYKSGQLTVLHPWSRATPPGAKVAGGYVTIKNEGTEPDRLVAVSSDIATTVEIHEMTVKANVMHMRMLENGLSIPANSEVALKPGTYHIMFMAPNQPLKAGDTFTGTFIFEKAGKVPVEFKVEAMGAQVPMHSGH